jgi:branched-chain amino acid transport system ATP-binding protein
MLAVENLEVVYDDVLLVLKGVSLTVPDGAVVALLGANGAGKTTVLRAVTGLLGLHRGEITKGRIELDGRRLDHLDAPQIVRAGIGQVMEGRRIFAELSVEENLRVGGYPIHRGTPSGFPGPLRKPKQLAEGLDRVYGLFPLLAERRKQVAGYLSGGEQQMLAIGRALMTSPRYLLLDEPSLGLAPLVVAQIRELLLTINRQGTAVLLVEQNASMALSIAGHGYVMEVGKLVLDKPAAVLAEDEDVREFYLGLHKGGHARSFRDVKHYRRRKRWLS